MTTEAKAGVTTEAKASMITVSVGMRSVTIGIVEVTTAVKAGVTTEEKASVTTELEASATTGSVMTGVKANVTTASVTTGVVVNVTPVTELNAMVAIVGIANVTTEIETEARAITMIKAAQGPTVMIAIVGMASVTTGTGTETDASVTIGLVEVAAVTIADMAQRRKENSRRKQPLVPSGGSISATLEMTAVNVAAEAAAVTATAVKKQLKTEPQVATMTESGKGKANGAKKTNGLT